MSLGAYWTVNFTFDLLRALMLTGAAVGLIYANKLGIQDIWIMLLIYPFAIVPFTYTVSFMFGKEGTS